MSSITFTFLRRYVCAGWFLLGLGLSVVPAFAADTPAPGNSEVIVSTSPMPIETEDLGAHGQLVVAPEIVSSDTRADLIYTITAEPAYGRVGLAGGGEDADFFKTKTSRLGYFAYRAQPGYVGVDTFSYSVRNETSGLVYKNTVVVTVKPPPPVVMEKFEVGANRVRDMNAREVSLTTKPNLPVAAKIPSHEDFMTPEARSSIANG
jgi:hypothetical protein